MMSKLSAELWDLAIAKCCQEPVHSPGAIQPFGALLVTDLAIETITHTSANLAGILGLDTPDLSPALERQHRLERTDEAEDDSDENIWDWDGTGVLGKAPNTILSEQLIHDLANVCGLPWIGSQRERMGVYQINGRSLYVCVHIQGDRTLIELEPLLPTVERSQTLVTRLKLLLQGDQDMQTVLAQCAKEIRHVSGFDRIMVYRFLQDGAGEVIAEARANSLDSFLNLRFPATDIPALTRRIFRKMALRTIPDLSAPLVPLLAWDETEASLDLSRTAIRGTSLVHTQEYLPNMGIASSMALAISIEGRLWGVLAFHHRQPKLLSSEFRAAIELCGLLISLYLQKKLAEDNFNHQRDAEKLLTQMFRAQVKTGNDWQNLVMQSLTQLCDLVSANGMAFTTSEKVLSTYGDVPESSAVLTLIEETKTQSDGYSWNIDSLPRLAESGKITEGDWNSSTGALFVPINFDGSFYLVFFRNEIISEVTWAGSPDRQQLVRGKNITGVQVRPQRSFDAYKQLVVGYCHPWSRQDLYLAEALRDALENQAFLQERHGLLVAELSHRVKNILALISSVANQTGKSTHSIEHFIQVLEQRISSLAMAHELITRRELSWPRLQDLLELELRPYVNGNTLPHRVTLTGPEVLLNSSFVPTFILVLHEMVSNAVKYGALSVSDGRLAISWFRERDGLTLLWREANGPTVHPPDADRRGFGSQLIERAIPYEFKGKTNLCFAPSGVEINFWLPNKLVQWKIPKSSLESSSSKLGQISLASPQMPVKRDQGSVLLVEDNMLITIEMENLLRKFGFSVVDAVPTVNDAMELLRDDINHYQICLLDINLKTATSFPIAYYLSQSKTSLVFVSGYDTQHPIPDDLKNIPLLKKPVNFSKLSQALQPLLKKAQSNLEE